MTQLQQHLGQEATSPELGPAEFAAIADYAKKTFGLNLPPAKREMVFARLIKRLRRKGVADFATYLSIVKDEENADERSEFLSALTTNVTQFFRENHHFEYLRSTALPPLIAKARAGARIRLWSAGCSAGQEPYSLAMTVLAQCPEANNLDLKILATDIDTRVLEVGRAGKYPIDERSAIPDQYSRFTATSGLGNLFEMTDAPRALITFAELNLIQEWPMLRDFDVIFCRNVAIYFDTTTQTALWNRFSQKLNKGGHLFIGHSERLTGPATDSMRNAGVTVYEKQTRPKIE